MFITDTSVVCTVSRCERVAVAASSEFVDALSHHTEKPKTKTKKPENPFKDSKLKTAARQNTEQNGDFSNVHVLSSS